MKRFYRALLAALLLVLVTACSDQRAAPAAPQIVSFSATPETLATAEGAITLRWEVQGAATELEISPGIGAVSGSSVQVAPRQTTVYTLTAGNAQGSHSAKVTVTVPVPEVAPPTPGGTSGGPNADLMGAWAFHIVGEAGTTLSGELLLDADFSYEGTPGVWGFVSACRGSAALCAAAALGGFVHEPGTEYQFGLAQMDVTLVFMGASADGPSNSDDGLSRLSGAGVLGKDEPATFEVYRLE